MDTVLQCDTFSFQIQGHHSSIFCPHSFHCFTQIHNLESSAQISSISSMNDNNTLSSSFLSQRHFFFLQPSGTYSAFAPNILKGGSLKLCQRISYGVLCLCVYDPHLSVLLTAEPLNDCHCLSYNPPTAWVARDM